MVFLNVSAKSTESSVERPRLTNLLHNNAKEYALTLLTGIAGSGKTTALEQWSAFEQLAESPCFSVAWTRLTSNSNIPAVFWSQLNRAFGEILPEFPSSLRTQTTINDTSSPNVTVEETLDGLFRIQHGATGHHYVLILDNFQLLDNRAICISVLHLLESLPENIHFVISGRLNYPVSLARLIEKNEVAIIDMQDLRMTGSEVADFFKLRCDIKLTAERVNVLLEQFEGWAAGMQLYSLFLNSNPRSPIIPHSFCCDDKSYFEYITAEVLCGLSEEELDFLITTSIFDMFDGELCDQMLGRTDSRNFLDRLLDNCLVEAIVTDSATLYRYPQYLRCVLTPLLEKRDPGLPHQLFNAASRYYEDREMITKAVRYALPAGEYARIIDLVERNFWKLYKEGKFLTLYERVSQIPEQYKEGNLYILLIEVFGNLYYNRTDIAESMITEARHLINHKRVSQPEKRDKKLEVMVNTFDALFSYQVGDIGKCIEYSERALSDRSVDVALLHCTAYMARGFGLANSQISEQSVNVLQQTRLFARVENCMDIAALTSYRLAEEYLRQGKLGKVREDLNRAIDMLKNNENNTIIHYVNILYAPLGKTEYEQNNLENAEKCFTVSLEGLRKLVQLNYEYDISVALSRLRFAEQRHSESMDILENTLIKAYKFKNNREIALLEAHIAALHAKLGYNSLAEAWTEMFDPNEIQPDIPRKELEHLTYSLILLTLGNPEKAKLVAGNIISEAKQMNHISTLIRAYVHETIAFYQLDMIREAYNSFDQVMKYAMPESYCRTILDESVLMPEFLVEYSAFKSLPRQSKEQIYLNMLIEASTSGNDIIDCPNRIKKLLSKRELDVYMLVQQGYKSKHIAEQLCISAETVKSYRKSINKKLEVVLSDDTEKHN